MHRGSLVPIAFSLCLVFSREINFMPTKTHTTHVGGVLTPKEQTFSATLNNQLNLARISLLVTRYL